MPGTQIHKPSGREVRFIDAAVAELRVDDVDEGHIFRGYAAVFDEPSVPLGFGFREVIRRGAFAKTIHEADIRSVWNHNTDFVLGRNTRGTLKLAEDERGLRVDIGPMQDDPLTQHFVATVRSGNVDQMSFAFTAIRDEVKRDGDEELRELHEVKLFEVSPVAFPAYEGTEIGLRSILTHATDTDFIRHMRGTGLTDLEIRGKLESVMEQLNATPDPSAIHLAPMRSVALRRLELLAAE